MGLTKQYLRYSHTGNFNIVSSSACNVEFVTIKGEKGRFVSVGAAEDIIIWDLRLREKSLVFTGDKYAVTCLKCSPKDDQLAAGFEDGTVKTFLIGSVDHTTCYSGHRRAVTCVTYDQDGHYVASGSKDSDIVVWDTVTESGFLRLTGHKAPVTQVSFSKHNTLISSSKDGHVKLWDLTNGHCFETLTEHRTEVWGLTLVKHDKYLLTGSGESEIIIWNIIEEEGEKNLCPVKCIKKGSILRNGRGRVVSLICDASSTVVACHGTDGLVELFYFLPDEEAKSRLNKRISKENKLLSSSESSDPSVKDIVLRLPVMKVNGIVKSICIIMGDNNEIRVAISLANNSIELHALMGTTKDSVSHILSCLNTQGHLSEVRALAFSSDNLAVASGAAKELKLWNRPSMCCLRTAECDYALCLCFVPGDRHLLVGLKDGHLLIVDVATEEILEKIPAHNQELWSLCLLPDQSGFVTGGGDCTVKFWNLQLIDDTSNNSRTKVLSALHTRTLKLEESVLALKISPNNKFLAVALLDCTVKIFFVDTLKFFLSLYGHSLPVLCLDISYDSTLIATGSADRNVKIWGLDFGDCHKSLFAHDESVTSLVFVPKTHHFFTCGKDGRIKQWDADTFDKIITLQGHHGEAWCIAVSPSGQFVVSSGSDRVLRLYERTSEPLVLEDEAEEERGAEELATGEDTVVSGHNSLNLPSKKTVSCEKAAEQLLECLDTCYNYHNQSVENEKYQFASALMTAFKVSCSEDLLIECLIRIRASDLEEALAILPFTSACELLTLISNTLSIRENHVELLSHAAMFLLKIHHKPLIGNQVLYSVLNALSRVTTSALKKTRDMLGYNLHALQALKDKVEQEENTQLFQDATVQQKDGERKKERNLKRALLMLN